MTSCNIITGYHQTSPSSAELILRHGFQPGSGGIAGGGIYFALNPEDTMKKAHHHGAMLCARVDTGRVKIMTYFDRNLTLEQLNKEGFDCVFLPSGDGVVSKNEYVVYESHRIKLIERSELPGSISVDGYYHPGKRESNGCCCECQVPCGGIGACSKFVCDGTVYCYRTI